jgi:hypothetical protein
MMLKIITYGLIVCSFFICFNFGISGYATQRVFDYKLPFRYGETWKVSTNGIHPDATFGKALDLFPVGNTSFDIIAPASGIISRGCDDRDQTYLTLDTGFGDNFSLLHLQKDSVPFQKGVKQFVRRGDFLGKISTVAQPTSNGVGCTLISTGPHLHLGFKSDMCPFVIDGISFDCSDGGDTGMLATSSNIPDNVFNKNNGKIFSQMVPAMAMTVVNSNPANQSPVRLQVDINNLHQKWKYDSKTRQIIGLNDQCLDGGFINDATNNWLRIQSCSSNSNQQWFIDNNARIHSLANFNKCIEVKYDMQFVYSLVVSDCSMNERQKFNITSDTNKSTLTANKIQGFGL